MRRFRIIKIMPVLLVTLCTLCGCGKEHMSDHYREAYRSAESVYDIGSIDFVAKMVQELGDAGFVAVDSENQVDMANYEKLLSFIHTIEEGAESSIHLLCVSMSGDLSDYCFKTVNGAVDVLEEHFYCEEGELSLAEKNEYEAYEWKYSNEGYLFVEEYHMSGYDGPSGHRAFRILPLDKKCRELNRMYILPVSYSLNNLFLMDWKEGSFDGVDFYDLYDIFYEETYGKAMPYTADENCGVGAVYHIPEEEFERVIRKHFNINSATLWALTRYEPDNKTYEYRPRGLYDCEPPSYPFPEVIGYTQNPDGTLTLTVRVVYPDHNLAEVYCHEVVIRPDEAGNYQYVSNRIIPSDTNQEESWHVPRLSDDEWKYCYGENVNDYDWMLPHAAVSLFSDKEKSDLEQIALQAAKLVSGVYEDIEIADDKPFGTNIREFTFEQRKKVVDKLGENGYSVYTDDYNMQGYEPVEKFYEEYLKGREASVTIFYVHTDGLLTSLTFLHRDDELQTYYVGIKWQEGGLPEFESKLLSAVAEIKLTEKGYIIYMYEVIIEHASIRNAIRIKPLSDECRELGKKYLSGIDYQKYNLMVTDWDGSDVGKVLMPGLFDDLYRLDTGDNFSSGDSVDADIFERIMMTYLPVTVEDLRENYRYDEASHSYEHEIVYNSPYPPFGEVTDYTYNEDGTITLYSDAVWPDYNSDCGFSNITVVQPLPNGRFRYLSNRVEEGEVELPPIANR